ncbi:hypothetical protein RHSIM_Rhsim01G0138100 [Rhododendron simsii]|uniref:Uncharacterized protein n=1 Tax=Rhododendron simsii TaxID=118357 RepID=A0A834LZH6_RHOSS|nr:hypothetical protein RHSIM_Rhsim01G0138100 [Rhododendron simsii]
MLERKAAPAVATPSSFFPSSSRVIDDLIMKTKTTTFFLVLFITLLLTLGPLQADAEKANYRRLLSDGWKFGQDSSSGDSSHRVTTNDNPPETWSRPAFLREDEFKSTNKLIPFTWDGRMLQFDPITTGLLYVVLFSITSCWSSWSYLSVKWASLSWALSLENPISKNSSSDGLPVSCTKESRSWDDAFELESLVFSPTFGAKASTDFGKRESLLISTGVLIVVAIMPAFVLERCILQVALSRGIECVHYYIPHDAQHLPCPLLAWLIFVGILVITSFVQVIIFPGRSRARTVELLA